MKSAEFLVMVTANANKLTNLRAYAGPWPVSISRVPDSIAGKVGHIAALIQAQIDQGKLCKKESEYLLLYNFQPLYLVGDAMYYDLSMLKRPLTEGDATHKLVGEPVQLSINGNTGEVMNSAKAMVEMKLITLKELEEEKSEPPASYGNYNQYHAPCCFITLASNEPVAAEQFFKGTYDSAELLQHGKVFENLLDARHFLSNKKEPNRYIAEMPFSESEIPRLKQQGLGKEVVKLMDYFINTVVVNPDPDIKKKDHPLGDELKRLHDAFNIQTVEVPLEATAAAPKQEGPRLKM